MARPVKHGNKWRIRWLDQDSIRRSDVFQTFKDADYALKKIQSEVEEIKKGLKLPSVPDKYFSEVCCEYLRLRSSQKRNPEDDESIIRVHLIPFFGTLYLKDFNLNRVDEFCITKKNLNPKTLHNILTLLISILRFAQDSGWLLIVPKVRKPRIRTLSNEFSYLKTEEEIERFLRAAKVISLEAWFLYVTALYTGMRAGELARLEWSDININNRLIVVKRSFNGPTKNGEIRYVPILDILLPVIVEAKARSKSKLVFTNQYSLPYKKSSRVFQEVLHRVLDRGNFPKGYIVFHDLRHTFASRWMTCGGEIFRLQNILGHKTPQMTQRYAHLNPAAFKEDHGIFSNSIKGEGRGLNEI